MKKAAKAPKKAGAAKKAGKEAGGTRAAARATSAGAKAPHRAAGKGAFTARVYVTYREGVLDPQGQTILSALHSLGFDSVKDVRAGKYFLLELKAKDREAAHKLATEMCQKLLANPVLDSYSISISE